MTTDRPTLTALIFAKDAAPRVRALVDGLRGRVDEVVVVSIGSIDETAAAAREGGARVIEHPPSLYVEPVRMAVLEQVTTDWILILDDDEVPDAALMATLTEIILGDAADVVAVPTLNYFFGLPLRGGGWQPETDHHARCFRRGAIVLGDGIHERMVPARWAREIVLDPEQGMLHHFSYVSLSDFLIRMDRYTTVEADALRARRAAGQTSAARYACATVQELLNRLIVLRGWRAGWRGRSVVLLMVAYRIAAWAKMREQQEGLSAGVVDQRYRQLAESLLRD